MSELVAIDYEKLFKECALARDEAGLLGSVPECIRYLDAEITRLQKELDTARADALEEAAKYHDSLATIASGYIARQHKQHASRIRALKDKEVAG